MGHAPSRLASSRRRRAAQGGEQLPQQASPMPQSAGSTKRESSIDLRDKDTPDAWIARDPDLERLTGNHPFNAETALSALGQGFVTPAAKGYVRNHGSVPRIDRTAHRLVVKGLGLPPAYAEKGRVFTMDELATLFPAKEVAVTFCCSGNRRREVNAVKPSIGVPFGAGAVRTSVFKGALLVDVLALCGLDRRLAHEQCHELRGHPHPDGRRRGCFVNFAGPPDELAKGEYATSLLLDTCVDPAKDILLAYECNGEPILPDQGFPLRLVIPGFIGGRMIKWLSSIEIAPHESASHYYYHDNRLFPSTVSLDRATQEEWWYRSEYIIGEMNINSVITRPSHNDVLPLPPDTPHEKIDPATCTLEGFAYTGGGRRIVIVEVSLDEGKTWEPCSFVDHPLDRPNPAGKFWAWRLWKNEVRAWDNSFNTQPAEIAWNVLGMMNNSRYTVQVQPARTRDGQPALHFAHPMPPHEVAVDKDAGRPPCEVEEQPKPQEPPTPRTGTAGLFTPKEVEEHNTDGDLWLVVNGKVYDVSAFVPNHPGGAGIIQVNAGRPCLEFDDIHSKHAHKLLNKYYIGEVTAEEEGGEMEEAGAGQAPPPEPAAVGEEKGKEKEEEKGALPPLFLDPMAFKACPLIEKETVTHDTRRFRFGLAHPDQPLGLPLGCHIYLRAMIEGEMVLRPYTPTSIAQQRGSFDLVVKIYAANQDPKYPKGGKMSLFLDSLPLGATVDVKGPIGRFEYRGGGLVEIGAKPLPHRVTHLGMLAGGTGITPMFQLIQAILRDPQDGTRCSLLFANKTPDDILLRPQLDHFAAQEAARAKEEGAEEPRFRTWYTVDRLPPLEAAQQEQQQEQGPWPFGLGHVTDEMIAAHLPPPGPGTLVIMCGPPPFVHYACRPALEKLGHSPENVFEF